MIPATSTTPMTVDDVKNVLNISTGSTTYDTYISNNLWRMAQYANDYCNGGLQYSFTPTNSQYTTLASSSTNVMLQPWLVENSVVVFSSDEAKVYTQDHDYALDAEAGTLWYLEGSTYGTSTGGYALIHYDFIFPQGGAKIAIAQLLRNGWQNDPYVVSESIGPLSRSYFVGVGDMPGPIKKLLNPHRRAMFR